MAKCESCQTNWVHCPSYPPISCGDSYQPKPEAHDKTLEETIREILVRNKKPLLPQILSAIQSKYVLLAENQSLSELVGDFDLDEDKIAFAHYSAGYSNAQQKMIRPTLNPDGTYDVWAKVRVTKEQLERIKPSGNSG